MQIFLNFITSRFEINNKKVLLRERKRHTARCVANTPYVVLTGYPPRGGTRSGTPPGGSGYPPGGYPVRYPRGVRYPPWGGTRSGTPGGSPGSGTPPGGVPSQVPPQGGYPDPPSPPVDRQTPVKTVPSRRTTYAGGN